jgi:hypothetical protein
LDYHGIYLRKERQLKEKTRRQRETSKFDFELDPKSNRRSCCPRALWTRGSWGICQSAPEGLNKWVVWQKVWFEILYVNEWRGAVNAELSNP